MLPDTPGNQAKPSSQTIELSPRRWLLLRVLIACLFGVMVTYISLAAGYSTAQHWALMPQQRTQTMLKVIFLDIESYREKHHALPRTFDQFGAWEKFDAWGHPFVYTIHGTDYTVMSYGQDGKPGGTGWDTDITPFDLHPVRSVPTYRQFLTSSITREAVRAALITGILAGLLCFVMIRHRPSTRREIAGLIPRVGIVLAAATVIGMLMTALHLPSGH